MGAPNAWGRSERTWPRPAHQQVLAPRGEEQRPVARDCAIKTALRARGRERLVTGWGGCEEGWAAESERVDRAGASTRRDGSPISAAAVALGERGKTGADQRTERVELAVEIWRIMPRSTLLCVCGRIARSHCGMHCSHTGIRSFHG
eukprot:3902731-Prymnesium_polylepis.1